MEEKHYELTYIISTTIAETEHPAIKQSVEKILSEHKVGITDQQDLGKKKFSYAIDKVRHGFYQSIEFNAMPDTIITITAALKLNNNVLRFLIISKKEVTAEEQELQAKLKTAQADKQAKTKEAEEKKEEETSATKVSLEDLDEKLDQILESDDLID
ncbi:MAG: 30S ribosomal protein S6 [Parcubacteria group bacterium CG1_02_37_51]|uniref:Small ribosomal subunit protein bS6 n=2 Tax=Candidatus Komeiliibacteriota TaxID=1817908 RepID=A0A2M8DSH3_9BACT|nr:MAG: 30S ribosomal protein S6 [Parcubacteria group bacterium CG1_02_37_51]PIY95363.1 MAG: 30S ribosomal protein S6 [Candidatus Komeilibacteria bacterium CG_4_10_14_0_8_um_filter_37_78]PJC02330.1 MAG: 30S ribosomal protein S6 [Candidatus Komeilibacteria bacterium CG_4_9_14_0_8_um_filter_36_9]